MATLDYQSDPQTIIIPSGAVDGDTACTDASVFILDDEVLESTETFSITLSSVSPCGDVDSGATVVEIMDDDSKLHNFRPPAHVCNIPDVLTLHTQQKISVISIVCHKMHCLKV